MPRTVTEWKWRLYLFAPLAANNADNRTLLARAFFDNQSGESIENEKRAFADAPRYARLSEPSVVVARGLSSAVKGDMRTAIRRAIDTINAPLSVANKLRWYAIANIKLPQHVEGELLDSNRGTVSDRIGTIFTWQDALDDLGLVLVSDS